MNETTSSSLIETRLYRRADMNRFLIISVVLHTILMIMHGLMPAKVSTPEVKPPVKVKYIQPEPPKQAKKRSTLIDAPAPKKVEKPRSSELLASHDSRAHSNQSRKKAKQYKSTKSTVPKVSGQQAPRPTPKKMPQKKAVPRPKPETKGMEKSLPFPIADKGFITAEPKDPAPPSPPQPQVVNKGSSLDMLDGFDPSKYAKLDTQATEDVDDGEVISLDTKETKYASYFARIKHQIQRVWDYPEEAARRGISGELTLRFQIQRDGDLMDVRLIEGSGSELLDFAAIRAIKSAAPFYPFPVTITQKKIAIMATFVYSPTYGAARSR